MHPDKQVVEDKLNELFATPFYGKAIFRESKSTTPHTFKIWYLSWEISVVLSSQSDLKIAASCKLRDKDAPVQLNLYSVENMQPQLNSAKSWILNFEQLLSKFEQLVLFIKELEAHHAPPQR